MGMADEDGLRRRLIRFFEESLETPHRSSDEMGFDLLRQALVGPVVGELQVDTEVAALEQRDYLLEAVAILA